MEPKWLNAARRELGTKEVAGAGSNPRVLEYFRASGHPEVHSDDTAWCSAFANWAMREAGIAGTSSLAARSWLRWGKPIDKGKPGAICVFSRGNSAWQGHVGFWLGETATHVRVLGGNQSDGVSIANYPKAKLLGLRWPSTMGASRTVKAAGVGAASTSAAMVLETVNETLTVAQDVVTYLEWARYAVLALVIAAFGLTIWFKWDDIRRKEWLGAAEPAEPDATEEAG